MSSVTCQICNKPLSRPDSIEVGMGEVCRHNAKVREYGNTTPLFRSKYGYWSEGDVIVMTDLIGDVSLTNDMENVLDYLLSTGAINSLDQKIIYRDSLGIWDGVRVTNLYPIRFEFYPINTKELSKALDKLKSL